MQQMSSDEVAQFRSSIRAAFGANRGSESVRAAMDTKEGWSPEQWQNLAQNLALPGLMLPEEFGGVEMSVREMSYVFEEAGGTLATAPLLSTCALAVPYLVALDDAATLAELGPALASGDKVISVVRSRDSEVIRADGQEGSVRLNGTSNLVVDGATADALLVVADDPSGIHGVFYVESGYQVEALTSLDLTRKIARITFDETPASRVGPKNAGSAVKRAETIARVLLAAEQVGGAQRCLDMSVEYAKSRIQFARPIGSFQIIKQRLADVLVLVESARSAVHAAIRTGAPTDAESRVAAISATHAFEYASALNIQIHGGIGFTWEHDAHLFFKRARTSAALLDDEQIHIEALAQILDREIA